MIKKQRIYLIEGSNGVGKSSLIKKLKHDINIKTIYSVPDIYTNIRKDAYNKLSDKASLMLYLSANLETFETVKDCQTVIFDRSFISSFAMYLSRIDEILWNEYIPFFYEFIKLIPKISKIYLLKVDEKIRQERIQKKIFKLDIENDMLENKFEIKKNKAREFLLKEINCNVITIDTNKLTEIEVFELVYNDINKDN